MSNYRDDQIKHFADVFKALSNPNRLRMFLHLVTCCVPGTVGSFDAATGVSACVGDHGKTRSKNRMLGRPCNTSGLGAVF
jgi:hypothetical protein